MSQTIKLRKGFDINLVGKAEKKITELEHEDILDEICEELFVATQLVNHNRFEN